MYISNIVHLTEYLLSKLFNQLVFCAIFENILQIRQLGSVTEDETRQGPGEIQEERQTFDQIFPHVVGEEDRMRETYTYDIY